MGSDNVLAGVGIVLLLVTYYDFLATVLTVTGGGPISGRLQSMMWGLCLRVHNRWPSHAKLATMGPVLTMSTLLFWALALWIGWTLIFCSDPHAVLEASSDRPATVTERVYFVGYTLTTLGLGDFKPGSSMWQIATVLTAVNGLFLFTMAITYIVPIINALASLRRLAAYIHRLGQNPADLVIQAWDGTDFGAYSTHFAALTPMVDEVSQQYLAYPILHYFHSPESQTALPVRLAVLDEALLIMGHAVEPQYQPVDQVFRPLREAIGGFLDVLHSAHIDPAEHFPPWPEVAACEQAGIPIRNTPFSTLYDTHDPEHRRRLLALLTNDGWSWDSVTPR